MQNPANLQSVLSSPATAGVGVQQNLVILTSPGEQKARRIWAIFLESFIDGAGTVWPNAGVTWHSTIQDGSGLRVGSPVIINGAMPSQRLYFPGGLRLNNNIELRAFSRATLANQAATIIVFYTTDDL